MTYNSYFGKGGEYVANIKEYNDKNNNKKVLFVKKNRYTQKCRKTNRWNSNKLDCDVIGYRGGATAHRSRL